MRYIDISSLTIPAGWLKKSQDALTELKSKPPHDRITYINQMQNSIWKDKYLLQELIFLTSKRLVKCWYSESSISDDIDIDHFRPKGRNAQYSFKMHYKIHLNNETLEQIDDDSNKGWWYLAFSYKNFRVCSSHRNQLRYDVLIPISNRPAKAKGKIDFFPLKKGSPVAIDEDGIVDEINCLLDPCNPKDPEYLSFDNLGKAFTLYDDSTEASKWIKCRVDVSIVIYHLDGTQLDELRKQKWLDCKSTIYEGLVQAIRQQKGLAEFERIKDDFYNRLAAKDTVFSAVAIDCIRYYKKQSPWLDKFFPDSKLIK